MGAGDDVRAHARAHDTTPGEPGLMICIDVAQMRDPGDLAGTQHQQRSENQ
jgi:hypothetical protein